jgi:pantoate--beta-alanine ligase
MTSCTVTDAAMAIVLDSISTLREALAGHRHTTFVPTMGSLHDGHLALVRQARTLGGPVVASIFVNRLQFGAGEDFDRYPRQFERDCALLQSAGCDMVFAPSEAELYPEPQLYRVVPPATLSAQLEGAVRPGFFEGVCTVVLKLLAIVAPRHTVFGKKDYQQWLIIDSMVRQLALPVTVVAGETIRADDGLALSSRNAYLSAEERRQATELYQILRAAKAQVEQGMAVSDIEQQAVDSLRSTGWIPDYVAVRSRDLSPLKPGAPAVILGAAGLGKTRLIDNIEC